jgi:NAD(P)-dependent dehydrogenase (short-subunit alcohol dehydrogenase family)
MQQRGSIVNCASVNSVMTMQSSAAYTASKHAVHGITKTVRTHHPVLTSSWLTSAKQAALEARAHSIRVNAISPGFLLTPMTASMADPNEAVGGKSANGVWEGFEARQGRKAHASEIGDAVVMLSVPRMSLVNGVNLMVDGGFTINEGFE